MVVVSIESKLIYKLHYIYLVLKAYCWMRIISHSHSSLASLPSSFLFILSLKHWPDTYIILELRFHYEFIKFFSNLSKSILIGDSEFFKPCSIEARWRKLLAIEATSWGNNWRSRSIESHHRERYSKEIHH